MSNSSPLADAVSLITKSIAQFPKEVQVFTDVDDEGRFIEIELNPEDMGRVIGKNGRTINAIRTLVKAAAIRTGERVTVDVIEEDELDDEEEGEEEEGEA